MPSTSSYDNHAIATQFIGVAMGGSASGVTNNIRVATTGVFRYPLRNISAVTIGSAVYAVSPTLSGTQGTSAQFVVNEGTQVIGQGTSAPLGIIVKTESGASFVDFALKSASGVSMAM